MDKKQCSATIYGGGYSISRRHSCNKPAVVERDGKPYCKIHDPEYIKEKNRKWKEKFDKEFAENRAKDERTKAMRNACSGLTTEELKQLNPNLLKVAPKLLEALKYIIRELDKADIIKADSVFMLTPQKAIAEAESQDD